MASRGSVLQAFRDQANEGSKAKGKKRSAGCYPLASLQALQGLGDEDAIIVLETAMREGAHVCCDWECACKWDPGSACLPFA